MKKLICITTILLSFLYSLSAIAALNVNLVYIARSGQKVPGQSGLLLTNFGLPQLNQGYISFIATDTLGDQGVFTNLYGYLKQIASNNTIIPGSQDTFNTFSAAASFYNIPDSNNTSIYGNRIVFIGTDHSWQTGIYSESGLSDIQLIANQTTPAPNSTSLFDAFAYPTALANGGSAFWAASGKDTQGIYYADPSGTLSTLVDTNTAIPNGNGNFTTFTYPSFSKNPQAPKDFAFVGYGSKNQVGLYLMKNNKLITVANNNTKLPGNNVGFFTGFNEISYDSSTNQIAFIGKGILGQTSIFVYNQNTIIPLTQQNSFIPSGVGNFKSFTIPNMENGFVLFKGTGPHNQEGIYLFNLQNEMLKVLSNSDSINNKPVKAIEIGSNALSGNQIAAQIIFRDGSNGIYLLTLSNT